MTVNDAVAKKIIKLLKEKNMTQYRLEVLSHIPHSTMQNIIDGNHNKIMLNTVMMIAKGFGMTHLEFLDDEVFFSEDLEIEI